MANASVIHDIGYRHYDGPRLGRASVRRALYVESLRAAFGLGRAARSKAAPFALLGLITLPSLVWAVVSTFTGQLPVGFDQLVTQLQPMSMMFVATQAPVLVARDLRHRVMPLYLSRPLSRADYVLAKFAAMASAVFLFLSIPLTALLAGSLLAKLPVRETIVDWAQAIAAAAVLSLLLAGIGLLIASLAPRRGLGVAAIITVLILLAAVQVATFNIADGELDANLVALTAIISPYMLVASLFHELFGSWTPLNESTGGWGMPAMLAAAIVVQVGLAVALLLARYRRVPVS